MTRKARHRPELVLLVLLFVLVTAAKSQGSGWTLEAYESCGQLKLKLPSPSDSANGDDSLDLAYQSDLGVLWLTAGSVLYKLEYSSGDVLASLAFEDSGAGIVTQTQLCSVVIFPAVASIASIL